MPRSIDESLELFDKSMKDIRTSLESKILSGGGTLDNNLRLSQVADKIREIETGPKIGNITISVYFENSLADAISSTNVGTVFVSQEVSMRYRVKDSTGQTTTFTHSFRKSDNTLVLSFSIPNIPSGPCTITTLDASNFDISGDFNGSNSIDITVPKNNNTVGVTVRYGVSYQAYMKPTYKLTIPSGMSFSSRKDDAYQFFSLNTGYLYIKRSTINLSGGSNSTYSGYFYPMVCRNKACRFYLYSVPNNYTVSSNDGLYKLGTTNASMEAVDIPAFTRTVSKVSDPGNPEEPWFEGMTLELDQDNMLPIEFEIDEIQDN